MWNSQLGVGRSDQSVLFDENEHRIKSKRANESEKKNGSAKKRPLQNNGSDTQSRTALEDISHVNNLPRDKNIKTNTQTSQLVSSHQEKSLAKASDPFHLNMFDFSNVLKSDSTAKGTLTSSANLICTEDLMDVDENEANQGIASNNVSDSVTTRPMLDMSISISSQLKNIDACDAHDPIFVSNYVNDIYNYLKTCEIKYQPQNYMTSQTDINPSMRAILVDWLVEVAEEYKLASETLYLSANFIDRYLSRKKVVRGNLQLLGIVCMLIASKFEEVYAPAIDEFVYISDNTYTKEEMFEMEELVLNVLKFSLCAPTIKTFLRRYLKAANADTTIAMLANYLCELTLQEYNLIKYPPSVIATAAVSLALHTCQLPAWTPTLEHYTGYKASDSTLLACLDELFEMYTNSSKSTLQAIRDKYSHSKLSRVSSIPPPLHKPSLKL